MVQIQPTSTAYRDLSYAVQVIWLPRGNMELQQYVLIVDHVVQFRNILLIVALERLKI